MPVSIETSAALFKARYLEAVAAYKRVRNDLDVVTAIVARSQLAVKRSRELIDTIAASRSSQRFSTENRCGQELTFSLGAPSADRLSPADRRMIDCVCGELDDIAAWEGGYEARTRFDALLQVFALSQDCATLH